MSLSKLLAIATRNACLSRFVPAQCVLGNDLQDDGRERNFPVTRKRIFGPLEPLFFRRCGRTRSLVVTMMIDQIRMAQELSSVSELMEMPAAATRF